MNGFRLESIKVEEKSLNTARIKLVNNSTISSTNYFTLLIGNNGTGKSRILSYMARSLILNEKSKKQRELLDTSLLQYNEPPSKIIAITHSVSDKFPVDKRYGFSYRIVNDLKHRDDFYNYIGLRNRLNGFSSTALMNKALDIIFESYIDSDISRNYRYVFNYLNYQPILKTSYKVTYKDIYDELIKEDVLITPDLLTRYLERLTKTSYFEISESLIEMVNEKSHALCAFINKLIPDNGKGKITINFSEKNISRLSKDNSKHEEHIYSYELINLLKRIKLIRTMSIELYKIDGEIFEFREASSGEANILSTLLALIPLLKDNSLILIDEPEISLHPLWQSKYIDLLDKVLESVSGCHVIIASHSPFLASDLNPENSCIVTLESNKGFITSRNIERPTYGWKSEDILLDVFQMETTRNYDLYESVSRALYLLSKKDKSMEELGKIKNHLRQFYPFILNDDPIKPVLEAIFKAVSYE